MLAVFSCKLEIALCENNEEEVYSFQWSHHEMLFTDTKALIWGVQMPTNELFIPRYGRHVENMYFLSNVSRLKL